jgi:hypothetical protein
MSVKEFVSLYSPASYESWKRTMVLPELHEVSGRVHVLAWPTVTEYVLNAALERNPDRLSSRYLDLHSYTLDFFTPSDPRRYLGGVAERLLLRAGPAGVLIALDVRAWKEAENAPLTESDFDYTGLSPVPFRLRDAAITLGGSTLSDIEEFTVAVDNNVQPGPPAGGYAAFLLAGPRTVSLDMVKLDNSSAINEAIREGSVLSFVSRFSHPDGHEMVLELPALYAAANVEGGRPAQFAHSRALFEVGIDQNGYDLICQITLA